MDGIALSITTTLMNGNYSLPKRCSPVALVLWVFVILLLNALCKSKAYNACGLKGTEQWIAQQRHILLDCKTHRY